MTQRKTSNANRQRATQDELSEVRTQHNMDNAAVNERFDKIEADLDEASTEITAELAKLRGIAGRAKKLADIIKPEAPPVDPAPSA
jgi:hypothetical protein